MNVIDIKESASNNILRWAILKGADIKNTPQLIGIINNDLFYQVTLDNVNLFEVFRLTQVYREKLRIIDSKQAEVPNKEELDMLFNGTFNPDPDTDEVLPLSNVVEHSVSSFINLVLQMSGDTDIINSSTPQLFLPMISVKYTIQIPVSFVDMVESISTDEANRLFNLNYPRTIEDILKEENHGFVNAVRFAMLKSTTIIKYNDKYEKFLNITKFSPLKSVKGNELYKLALVGFYKYDNVTRGEVRCELFNAEQNSVESAIKRMAWLNTPLYVEFAVQLPIFYMQILENFFNRDTLSVTYESSMDDIFKSGIIFNDFISPEFYDVNDEEREQKVVNHNNAISAYKVRITEVNHILTNAISLLLNSDRDSVDITSVFSMLPSIYNTKAIITINATKAEEYIKHPEPIIAEMFEKAFEIIEQINSDISNSQK